MVRELKIKSVKWNHKFICLSLFLAFGKHVFIYRGFPDNSVGKESACSAGDTTLIPGSGRSAGEAIGYPLQYSWASLVAQLVKNHLQCGRPGFDPWVGKISWRRERLLTPVFWPTEFHGLYSPWGHKEPKMTEQFPLSLWAFSGCIQQGLFSGFSALASHCTGCIGFSVAPHRLSCLMACGISQDQG